MTRHRSVPVATPSAAYTVEIGPGLLATLGETTRRLAPRATAAVIVFDANLPHEHKDAARTALRPLGLRLAEVELTPSEPDKSVETWKGLLARFAAHRLERTDVALAIGGGIVGDTAGFAAAAYRRGVPVIQCPTTLLAMVDASVGGKTGVNLLTQDGVLLKNGVGAFHQPAAVIADIATLGSLDPRDFACGLAECIKHAMIAGDFGDPDLGPWIDGNAEAVAGRDHDILTELVARNVAVKAAVVATDERETATGDAGRALLNLGHTFGHAIETIPELGLRHGEAVALGLRCAARYARLAGTTDIEQPLTDRLQRAVLPTTTPHLPPSETVLARMAHDKKAAGGRIRLVVPTSETTAAVIDDADPTLIRLAIDAIRD
ncbi:MAG: 3-dehydroquinate synthase family protein [Phycisphaerales bacterium]